MKNYTLRSLYLTMLVVLFAATPRNVQAQCATTTTPGTPAMLTPTTSWQTLTTQSGRYYTFSATAGCTYTFSHCQGGGSSPAGFDQALSLTNTSNTSLMFNDDGPLCTTGGSEIIWLCPTTGTYRIHHEKCCCVTTGPSQTAVMAYKVACPCAPGVALATPNSVCFGQNVTLTLSGQSAGATFIWQESTDNVVFTDISPTATVSPYVHGPLSATRYFRAKVTCTGVGNTVGVVNTSSVQVTVNQLPVINFPAQTAPNCCNNAAYVLSTATPANGQYSATVGVSNTGPNQYTFTPAAVCNGNSVITYSFTDPSTNCTGTAQQTYVVNDTPAVTFGVIPDYCIGNCGSFPLTQATPAGGVYGDFTINNFVSNGMLIPCNADGPLPTQNYVSYTYTSPTTGCTSNINQTVNINSAPAVTLTDPGDFCVNAPGVQLLSSPSGGVFSDDFTTPQNVSPTGFFTPTDVATHTISYVYTDGNGCAGLAQQSIDVNPYPTISWALPFPQLCENSPALNLNGYGLQVGGNYTSTDAPSSVAGNVFNPAGQSANSPLDIIYELTLLGCTSRDSQAITVIAPPAVTFNGPVPAVCVGSAPFALAPYVTPAGGTWSSVPNNGSINTTTGQFTPGTAGNYTITYTFVQGSCQNTVTFQVVINALPTVTLPAVLTTHCVTAPDVILNMGLPAGPGIGVYSGSGVSFNGTNWVFDPSVGSTTLPDTFLITYTYTDPNGCSNFDTASIMTNPQPVVNFPPLADVCDNGTDVLLLATPAGGTFSGTWVTGPPAPQFFQPGPAPIGNHTVTYIYTNTQGCSDTATQNIIVKPITGPINICSSVNPSTCGATNGSFCICGLNPNTQYVLTYRRNGVLQGPFSVVSNGSGQYCRMNLNAGAYTEITMALNGCPQLDNNVFVTLVDPNAPPAPTAGANTPLCEFSTLQLTATTGVINGSFNWTGPNSFFSNQQNPSILNVAVNASGNYSVTVTNSQNCTSLPGTVAVVVNPAPNLTVGSNSPVCAGNDLNLTANSTTPGTTFQWTGPVGFFSIAANPTIPAITPLNAGWYKVTATGTNGCTRKDSVLVVVGTITPITPTAGGTSPICSGTTLNLTATNSTVGAGYIWSGPGGWTANTQNPARPNIQLADEGLYIVKASLNGCESDTTSVYIEVVQSLTPMITITPNPSDTVCFGTNIEFTSSITDGGSSPIYQWYINGIPVIGAIDSFWGSPYLTDLDTVTAVLINSTSCTTVAADTSNKVAIHMAPNTIPTVTIGSVPLSYVAGVNMDFTAYVLNGGTNPAYQWFLNGTILPGETNMVYSSSTLTVEDTLSVLVTSNAPCAIPDTSSDIWNAIINLSVTVGGKVIEDMQLFPNPNNGTFTLSGSFNGMTGVKDAKVEVVNAVGQVVYKDGVKVINGKLDKQMKMADVSAGVYMLRITAEGQSMQMKFVINK